MEGSFVVIAFVLVAVVAFLAIVWQQRRVQKLLDAKSDLTEEKAALLVERAALLAEKASLQGQISAKEQYQQEMRVLHEKELQQMQQTFENMVSRNSLIFQERSGKAISELMRPIQDKFTEFSKAVSLSQEKSIERHSRLEQKILDLDLQSRSISDEARNLANAITGYSKIQGNFGEMLLTDVLKNAGLVEGIHYITQGVITDESGREIKSTEGKTMIPDVIILFPDDTRLIVDSKVSLTAFNKYMNSSTAEDRVRYAKAHVESIRSHVDELKNKDYAAYIPDGQRKIDYNIMFVPIDGAFTLMLDEDPTLWQTAKDNNVLIVSQMTLIIVLNMVQLGWKQYDQEKNIADVYKTAEELMSQLKAWMESYVQVGALLGKVQDAYQDSKKKLSESNQSVIKKIGKLEKLGLSPKRSNAKLKTGSRLVGTQSIIPAELDND